MTASADGRAPRGPNIKYPDAQDEEVPEATGYLDTWDIACLIINKMIGTGIFTTPASVVVLVGSKYGALLLWLFGAVYSFISMLVYLEYGLAWPFTGGEFTYITKIFPRPALVTATSFAWFFVAFSTSTGNALNFAKYISLAGADFTADDTATTAADAWQLKFIACWVVVAICLLHYRLIDIGVWSNFGLAGYKVLLLTILVVASGAGFAHERRLGGVRGAHDWRKLAAADLAAGGTATDSSVNVALAMFLVLYSYQGWENANYITADIEGGERAKRRKLKKGALWAVGLVSVLYIAFNLVFFLLLSNADIQTSVARGDSVAYDMALHSFHREPARSGRTTTRRGIGAAIALSALGNLVGVIFTNGRVKREMANDHLIPGSSFFAASSTYGRLRDSAGTPTGGLVLHGLATCITVTATGLGEHGSSEGLSFVINLFTYGHSVMGIALGFGLFSLRTRLQENKTDFDGDIPENTPLSDSPPAPTWHYKMLRHDLVRGACAVFFIAVHGFLVVLPMVPSRLANGAVRRIPSWELPAVVLPVFAAGAFAGFLITIFATHMEFRTGANQLQIPYAARRWLIQFPRYGDWRSNWRLRRSRGSVWAEAKTRLMGESEASHAREIRSRTWRGREMSPVNAAEGAD
ncbi:hypothetical protein B2J93_8613 [Marssonina coronariae]|uniref:Amino acid transporter n=1 Tax=Diplocarpon coronariae TaxID=2795749 RepID=A0A218YX51_9HELO|nr:hypothetical protein B2J93_8613 [Marssonina coronariae]